MALQSTTALATITLQSPSLTINFNNIPSTYRDLILVWSSSTEVYSTGNGKGNSVIRFNGDATSAYSNVQMSRDQNGSLSTYGTQSYIDCLISSFEDDVNPTLYNAVIYDYSQIDKHKTVLLRSNLATGNQYPRVSANAYRWASTSVINSISLFSSIGGNFNAGSTFSLYGVIA